jgi:hypothetical protein
MIGLDSLAVPPPVGGDATSALPPDFDEWIPEPTDFEVRSEALRLAVDLAMALAPAEHVVSDARLFLAFLREGEAQARGEI